MSSQERDQSPAGVTVCWNELHVEVEVAAQLRQPLLGIVAVVAGHRVNQCDRGRGH